MDFCYQFCSWYSVCYWSGQDNSTLTESSLVNFEAHDNRNMHVYSSMLRTSLSISFSLMFAKHVLSVLPLDWHELGEPVLFDSWIKTGLAQSNMLLIVFAWWQLRPHSWFEVRWFGKSTKTAVYIEVPCQCNPIKSDLNLSFQLINKMKCRNTVIQWLSKSSFKKGTEV